MSSRTYQASDFPLQPLDASGQVLTVGDFTKIIAVPDVAFHGFDEVARARYTAMKNRVLPIAEFDESGYVVFALYYTLHADLLGKTGEPAGVDSFQTHDFCFDPRDLELVQASPVPAGVSASRV